MAVGCREVPCFRDTSLRDLFQLVYCCSVSSIQVILMGPSRLVLALHLYYYDRIVRKGMQKREESNKTK